MAERERATRAAEKLKEESAQRVKYERELEDQKVCHAVSYRAHYYCITQRLQLNIRVQHSLFITHCSVSGVDDSAACVRLRWPLALARRWRRRASRA